MNLYSPDEWMAANAAPAPVYSQQPQQQYQQQGAQPRTLSAAQMNPNYNPTSAEVEAFGGINAWRAAYKAQGGVIGPAPTNADYVGVSGVARDMNGNVIAAGSQSGYKVGDNFSQPNRMVGLGSLNTSLQDTIRANPMMTSAEVDALSTQQTELQMAYRSGMIDEQTAHAAYAILADKAVVKHQAQLVQQANQAHVTPPQAGDAGLATTGGMVQPTGQFADGRPYYGRPIEEIRATGYMDDSERIFFLNSIGKTLDANGNVVMLGMPAITPPQAASSVAGGPAVPGATPTPLPAGSGSANWADWGELPGGRMAQWAVNNGYNESQIIYQGQTQFPPQVEQWRPLVSQYFRPEDVNHALWLLQRESGGQNIVQHGGGPGTGLFQVEHGGQWPGRPSQQQLLDPATNIAYAASMVYGG